MELLQHVVLTSPASALHAVRHLRLALSFLLAALLFAQQFQTAGHAHFDCVGDLL